MVTSSQLPQEEALAVNSTFRRKYGIPPKGTPPAGGWADSDYGFPLPPAGHPQALQFAHAVLSRAHQSKNFDPVDVAKQVAKAKRIIAQHEKKNESVTPWREVRWLNLAQRRGKGFASVNPRKNESRRAFFNRCPAAVPASRVEHLEESQLQRLTEGAIAIRNGSAHFADWSPSNQSLREAVATDNVVKDVLLIREGPGNPADGHYYSKECIQTSVESRVFEGAQCYLDHSSVFEERNRPERSVKDLAGWYSDVYAKPYTDPKLGECLGLFATFHPAVGKPEVLSIVRTCVEYARQYPRMAYAGLSISAYGDGEPDEIGGKEYLRVDRITAVESVDIVTRAGAGGAIVPLREGFRVKTGTQQDIKLTVDVEKVREGLVGLTESQKTKVNEFLKKLKIKVGESEGALTDEQIAELGKLIGVDESAVDALIDGATGVIEEGVKKNGGANDDDDDDDGETDDDPPELDEAAIKKMSPAQLAAAFKKQKERADKAEARAAKAKEKVAEANRVSEKADRVVRERMADNVLAELNIPEAHRPRLKHELIREGFTTEAKMREHAKNYDLAFIRGGDGSGNGGGNGAQSAGKITLSFTE